MSLIKKIIPQSWVVSIQNYLKNQHFWNVPNGRFLDYEKLQEFAATISSSGKVLDVGAGLKPYESFFKHCTYHSCDIENAFFDVKHDYICSSERIPVPDNSYDGVILIQVLEHLEYPIKTLNEIHRLLRPGGVLYLAAPQGAGDHFAPYHFYNFTQFGLKSLLSDAGFTVIQHYRLDGICILAANSLIKMVDILEDCHRNRWYFFPLIKLFKLSVKLLALVISKLDFLDTKRDYCIENIMWAKKT